ncbi:MAG TPA: hypothetical protein DDW27_19490 [Bacteroidales bacterium]|nr:hypothetical protein [Bacteroidales bacterium]
MLGEPASVRDKMNGKVQKVVFKLFWGTGTGNDITKGNHFTTRERDSLRWFYDFEATFDNTGDHIINYNTLDDNNNPVNTWNFIKENNLIVLSKWSFRKPGSFGFGSGYPTDGYTKYINNEKGLVIKKEDRRAHDDSLLYSFTIKYNEPGDEIETQAFDGKGNFFRKWTIEYNDKRQAIGGVNYGPDGNIRNSYKNTINDRGKISESTSFDKDKNVIGNAKYTYLEYDAKGNWIKVGLEYGPFTTYGERTITYYE